MRPKDSFLSFQKILPSYNQFSIPQVFTTKKEYFQLVNNGLGSMIYAPSMTEKELIQACLRNERLAQKELYDRYSKAMYTSAYRITNDFELANDVLQEAFVKIFKNLAKFRQESTLGAWIKTIVVRTALSKIKKQKNFDELEEHHTKHMIDWGDFLNAEYLEKAIQALPEGYRAVFLLIEVEGYSHKEVAEMLHISTGTSKSQLFYAKKRLRAMLKEIVDLG